MKNYCLLTAKKWHDDLFYNLSSRGDENWIRINNKKNFNKEFLAANKIDKIFIPHWSYLIHEEIFKNYECIVFHMTDLPYGRGGSPLQNLIFRGHDKTKISAIQVSKGIDTGPVYLKEPLSLLGTAEEIFIRCSKVIEKMIVTIINKNLEPEEQSGEAVIFKRCRPEDSDIGKLHTIEQVYNHIRMLDCEGYPPAFLETDQIRIEFSRASLKADNSIIADVRITKK